MKMLFVCNQGWHRSPTAAELFSDEHDTRFAGCFSEENPVSSEMLLWADTLFVMEEVQRAWLVEHFPKEVMAACLITLDIPDVYQRGDPKLVSLLEKKVSEWL